MMNEPDELYTLRAQFWLGHYRLALDEAKSVARRPMSASLKQEREEFLMRCYIELGQYDKAVSAATAADSPGLQALALKAQYEANNNNEAAQEPIVDQMKSLLGSNPSDPCVQLTASHMFFKAGQTKEAMSAIASAASSSSSGRLQEHSLMKLQILIKIDRVDLAKQTLERELMKHDEEAVLAQLGNVYVALATGKSMADDAVHSLHSLSEQYGPSPTLLNLLACALMQQGDYAGASQKLQECLRDHPELVLPDTLINLIACSVQTQSTADVDVYLQQMKAQYPQHQFCAGLERVNRAFDRESVKYKV